MLASALDDVTGSDSRHLGVWTTIGRTTWTTDAYRRIYERELQARLPEARIRFVGDLADDAVAVSQTGDVIASLGSHAGGSGPVIDRLVAVAPGMTDLAAICRAMAASSQPLPLVLSALSADERAIDEREPIARAIAAARDVSVRDTASIDRVRPFRGRDAIALVPDPLVLFSRLTAPGVARSRIEYLRTMDRYPVADTVLIEVSATRTGHLAWIGTRVTDAIAHGYRLVVVALPMDGQSLTDELRRCIERAISPVYCFDRPSLEDLAAAIATSTAVIPLSPALLAAACAFGRPSLRCPEATWDRHHSIDTALPGVDDLIRDDFSALLLARPDPSAADAWCEQLDSHFDRIVRHLSPPVRGASRQAPMTSRPLVQLEASHRLTARRLAEERLRFAEHVEGLLAETRQLRADVARRGVVEAALREEMAGAYAHARHEVSRHDLSRQRTSRLESENARLQASNAQLQAAIVSLEREIAVRDGTIAGLATENAVREAHVAAQARELDDLRAAVQRFLRSKSWRYLAPARAAGWTLRRWFGRGR